MKINLQIPSKWDELSEHQLRKVMKLFHSGSSGFNQEIKAFKILCNTKWWQLKKCAHVRFLIKDVPRSELMQFYSFLFEECNRTIFIPVVNCGKVRYFAPGSRINNLTAEEFACADDFHILYRKTKNPEYLQYLFHTLYSTSSERGVFDKLKLDKLINKKIPLDILLATEATYMGCKNHIAKKFKKAFPKAGGNSGKNSGFGKVISAMAKGDLSKLSIVENINIYKFLDQFQDDIEIYQKQKSIR
jgi:hypothetical protein